MAPTNGRSGGTLLFFVAAALLVAEVLAVSFYSRSVDSNKLARRAHGRDLSAHLADAVRASVVAALRRDLARPTTSNLLKLVTGTKEPSRLEGREVPLSRGWDAEVKQQAVAADASFTTSVRLRDLGGLDGASLSTGVDPLEKKGMLP